MRGGVRIREEGEEGEQGEQEEGEGKTFGGKGGREKGKFCAL